MKIFIGYSRKNSSALHHISTALTNSGHSVWYDDNLLPGLNWRDTINAHICDSDVFIPIISEWFVASPECKGELTVALDNGLIILPVCLDKKTILPNQVNHLHTVFYKNDVDSSRRLLGGLSLVNSKVSASIGGELTTLSEEGIKRINRTRPDVNSVHLHFLDGGINKHHIRKNLNNKNERFSLEPRRIIGIDFGTASSVCAIIEDGQPTIIPNKFASRSTPSAIYFNADGSYSIGETALHAATRDPRHAVLHIKRLFGTNKIIEAYGKTYRVPEVAALILHSIVEDCSKYLEHKVDYVVMGVPAYFSQVQLDDLREAVSLAGLQCKLFIAEPTCAGLAASFLNKVLGNIVVFDMGAGTFDVSILEVDFIDEERQVEVLSVSGDCNLGGMDYDQALVDYCIEKFQKMTGVCLDDDLTAHMRIRQAAELAKQQLSILEETIIHVSAIHVDPSGVYDLTIPITKTELNELTEEIGNRIMLSCRYAVTAADIKVEDIDDLIFAGLSSRVPTIKTAAESYFGCKSNMRVEPENVVAIGAAVKAAVLEGIEESAFLLDVTSHSLGIAMASTKNLTLINRNTSIPTRASQMLCTTAELQTSALIKIIETIDDDKSKSKNSVIAQIFFGEITPMKRGAALVEIMINIDGLGLISLTVRDVKSNTKKTFNINESNFDSEPANKDGFAALRCFRKNK